MRINCNTGITNLSGDQIAHPDGRPATFGTVCVEALLQDRPDGDPAARSYANYALAKKVSEDPYVDLDVEELATIKRAVTSAKSYNCLVIGRMFDIIEGRISSPMPV